MAIEEDIRNSYDMQLHFYKLETMLQEQHRNKEGEIILKNKNDINYLNYTRK